MEQLKAMKEQLTSLVQGQLSNVQNVDTKELGEAIDMIKDLAEAVYYCSITDAMEESNKEPKGGNVYYYTMPYDDYKMGQRYNDGRMEYDDGRMYYGGNSGGQSSNSSGQGGNSSNGGSRMYTPRRINPVYYGESYMPNMYRDQEWDMGQSMMMPHDPREGRARESRRMYMESKEMHKDAATQMKDLEKYIKDLGEDITEMIQTATPEEKQVLQQKIATLATKIK